MPENEFVLQGQDEEDCNVKSNAAAIPVPDESHEVASGRNSENFPEVEPDYESTEDREKLPDDESIFRNAVADGIEELNNRISALEKLFKAKILHSEHEKKIVDQMHNELQRYKQDMYFHLVRPILLDMIEIRDSILRVSRAYTDKPDGEQAVPVNTFSMYAYDVQEILEKNNIEIFRSEEKSDFVPVRQKVIKKVPTHDPDLHGKIAESLSDGYGYEGRIISAERVAVYIYDNSPAEETENNDNNKEEIQNG